ncbi:MAG: hypothetical protein AB1656_03645 [Candidatus Omnitrophota bacterium]
MKTADDAITDFRELAQDQQEKVIDFVTSIVDQEEFSEEDTALILEAGEEAKQGINMSGPFVGEEAINYLRRLRKAKF